MNTKRILSLVLVIVLSVLALTSCGFINNLFNKGPQLEDAVASLTDTYKDTAGKETTKDFDIVGKVILDGAEFTVTWASDNKDVVVKPAAKDGWYTVDVPDENATPVNYKLTATITDAKGNTASYELALKLPVYQKQVEAVSTLEENTPYKVHIAQMNLAKHLFATMEISTSSSSGESFIKMTTNLADSVDFYAEKSGEGYKFYVKDGDAKKYVTASVTETVVEEKTKYVKCLNFADTTETVWMYNDNLGIWYFNTLYGDYVLGNYGTYDTVSMSQSKYYTADTVGLTQFVVKFITAEQAAALDPIVLPIPDEITSIADANAIAAELASGATTVAYYRVKGTITEIQNDYYGNIVIADEDGNSILIYGLNSKDGSTKYGNMTDKPVVGDTITVVSKIKNYNGNKPELENAMLYEVVKGETQEPEVDPVVPPTAAVPAPTGKYHLVITQKNVNKNLYLTGATANKDYYIATVDSTEGAMLFEVEAVDGVDGAFRIFFYNAENVKTYIEMYQDGTYFNLKLTAEVPATYYTYDAEYNTAVCEFEDGAKKAYFGAYKNYETASGSNYDYISTSFPAVFVEVEAPKAPEAPADPLADLDGDYVVNFLMDGAYQFSFNKEAGSFTLVDNIGNFGGTYTYTYDAATGITVAGDVSFVFAVAEDGSITVSIGGGAAMPLLVAGAGDGDDEDDGEEATILEPTDVKGTITLEATDTYCFIDLYGFKAPAAGTYYFLFEKGTGLQTKASYDAWGTPEVGFYDGGVFSVTLEEGEVCYFYFAALLADTYEIEYSNEEIVVIPPVELETGANTLTFTADNLVTGIECVFTPYSNGAYTFKSDVLGANIYDATGTLVGRGFAELESYCEYTVVVYPLSEEAAAGDYVLNIVAPIILGYDYDNTVELDADQIANGFNAYITPYNPGKLSLTSETLTLVSVVDADGNELVANEDGSYNVLGWVKYTVSFTAKEGAAAGEHTIVPAFVYAPGTAQNPYTLEATNNVVLVAEGIAYYQYVATANGYLSISGEATNLQFRDEDYNSYLVSEENSIFVMAGETYLFTFSTTDYAAIDTTVTASFVEGEITEEILKGMLDGSWFYINDEYQITFENGMITVAYYDWSVYDYTLRLAYSYTVAQNEDGTLTILPTYVQTEGEIGVDFGFSGSTVTATEGEYGYEFTCELNAAGGDEPTDPTSVVTNLTTDGVANAVVLEANTYAYAELYIVGNYKITWDVEGLVVLVNNVPVASGDVFYAASPRAATIISISGADYAAVSANVTIASYIDTLAVGDNTVTVNDTFNGAPVQFTAEAAGTYVFTAGANTLILVEGQYGFEPAVDGVYTVALEAGASASFNVLTADYSVGDVAVNVVKKLTDAEIVEMAYGLAAGEKTTEDYTLTGVITSIKYTWSASYGTASVYIQIGDLSDKLIYCYNLAGDLAPVIKVGDTITVTGKLYNYVKGETSTIEFDSCSLDNIVTSEEDINARLVDYELANLKISTSYNADATVDLSAAGAQFNNVAITWTVNGEAATQLVVAQTAEAQTITVVATLACGEATATKEFVVAVDAKAAPGSTITTKADFDTMTENTSYVESESTNGWIATNAAVIANKFGLNETAVVINGKTSAVGQIVSPTLAGGVTSISFKYGYAFSEGTTANATINIKKDGVVVATTVLNNTAVSGTTAYDFVWELDAAVEGDVVIEIVNNSPSNSTKNKDRLFIWDLQIVSAPVAG